MGLLKATRNRPPWAGTTVAGLGVGVVLGLAVAVGEGVGLGVSPGAEVGVGVAVGVVLGVALAAGVGVGLGVSSGAEVGVGVAVGGGAGVAVAIGVETGVGIDGEVSSSPPQATASAKARKTGRINAILGRILRYICISLSPHGDMEEPNRLFPF